MSATLKTVNLLAKFIGLPLFGILDIIAQICIFVYIIIVTDFKIWNN